MTWQQTISERKEIVLATSSKDGEPNAIVVISMGMMEGKLLIGVCQMNKTLENIKSNDKVVVVGKDNGEYYRVKGIAMVYSEGNYFDYVYQKSNPPMPKAVLAIEIKEVFDLDKLQIIPL